MSDCKPYENPLIRDGQSQKERTPKALSPDYVHVDERKREDFLAFAREYSKLIQYYDDSFNRSGNWEAFFREGTAADQPHYALFLAFTWLFRVLQEDINTITERHLDHYYKEILRLKTKPAQADSVHVLFEIAKNIDQHLLKKGTLLKAGKDESGKELLYALDEDLVLNKASISQLKAVFREQRVNDDGTLNSIDSFGLYASPIADSSDGLGQDKAAEGFQWKLFGESQENDPEFNMPQASIGFAVASPILFLKEGHRKIKLGITFSSSLYTSFIPYFMGNVLDNTAFTAGQVAIIRQLFSLGLDSFKEENQELAVQTLAAVVTKIRTTGILESIGENAKETDILSDALAAASGKALESAFIITLSGNEDWIGPFITNARIISSRHISLELELTSEQAAIVNYNAKVLGNDLNTTQPALRALLNSDAVYRYDFLQELRIDDIKIEVEVTGIKNLVLQNDNATLNADKQFQPFGPLPILKSHLYIGCAEAFQKQLQRFQLNINWADTPESFEDHYGVYNNYLLGGLPDEKDRLLEQYNQLNQKHENDGLTKDEEDQFYKVKQDIETINGQLREIAKTTGVFSADSFKANLAVLNKGNWQTITTTNGEQESPFEINLFDSGNLATNNIEIGSAQIGLENIEASSQINDTTALTNSTLSGFARLQLTAPRHGRFEAFGHKGFPTFYTEKIIEKTKPENADKEIALPNEPYTPTIASISLDYQSETRIRYTELGTGHQQFFLIAPFGIQEKRNAGGFERPGILPSFSEEGTLYIGIKDLVPQQNLSILFQLNEKSVNHEFVGKVETKWSYLSNNEWKEITEDHLLEDHTEVFTRSGIVKFSMPKDIGTGNTLLPSELHWLSVSIPKNTLGIADAYHITAQAVTATFVDQGNSTTHLETALTADSIKKFKVNNSAVKNIAQPYASFGGQLEETSETFYTRVSERLRHKRRAISIWDYERLILEAFPSVYKVKCLNHYDPNASACQRQLSPGAVTLLILSRVDDETDLEKRLAPVTNVITLSDIKSYLLDISSPFIAGRNKLFVRNPAYEYLSVKCSIKFRTGYDASYYNKELIIALQQYFSPWAFDNESPVSFERKVYKSLIINYIEELEYVDFVCCFKLMHVSGEKEQPVEVTTETLEASDPANILISASTGKYCIKTITGDLCDCSAQDDEAPKVITEGIGVMVVESDFKVKEKEQEL